VTAPTTPTSPRRSPRPTPAKREAHHFPIVVAEWPRNRHELVRISLDLFNGYFTVSIRAWWRDSNGIFRPGRDGLTLGIQHLPKLFAALADAVEHAQLLGLVDPATKNTNRTRPQLR
jgi:hypothetical protein